MCRYLASQVQLRHLTLVIVNDRSRAKSDVQDMQRICQMDIPWVKHLTLITGLRSLNLHTARCPFLDTPFEGRNRCPTTLPLAHEIMVRINETQEWTEEDRTSGLLLEHPHFEYENSKNPMTRHIELHRYLYFDWTSFSACISQRFKEQLRAELGIQSSANVGVTQRRLEGMKY